MLSNRPVIARHPSINSAVKRANSADRQGVGAARPPVRRLVTVVIRRVVPMARPTLSFERCCARRREGHKVGTGRSMRMFAIGDGSVVAARRPRQRLITRRSAAYAPSSVTAGTLLRCSR